MAPLLIRSGNTRTIMSVTIAIVGCLDTKGEEVDFLREVIENTGNRTWVIDTGVLEPPAFEPETSREAVAEAGGASLVELLEKKDRGFAMTVMSAGAAAITAELFASSQIDGIIAAGGSANTTIGASAMQALPVGFPKLLVSTLACGDVSAWVGTRDITMMYSVVDIAGINRISAVILRNAANAVVAMAAGKKEEPGDTRPLIAASMFGVTTPCVTEARRVLEEAGFEVIVFHATGAGGRTMEALISDGLFAGVLDITTTELADERVGGILSAGPGRLTAAGLNGTPQLVSTGATDMVNFGGTRPAEFEGRLFYKHNPTVTLMRTSADECRELGREIAEKVSGAKGPAAIMLPLSGVSAIDREGEAFDDPAAREALFDAIRNHPAELEVNELPLHINDPEFAAACARRLVDLIRQ
ncbi:MAG: Tm-1-like ATP-binding domain-containing protein [Planctomycetota bacterium]|nr:Tm-1-like ATP-binding domain-containing protein [Planctomycetota bacterium]